MRFAAGNVVSTPTGTRSVGELRADASTLGAWANQRILLASDDPHEQLTGLLAAATVGFELAVVPADWLTAEWLATVRHRFHWACTGLDPAQARRCDADSPVTEPRLVVHTSGSTRAPAPVSHRLEALDTFERLADLGSHEWLVAYRTGSYAWTQVAMLGLLVAGQHLRFARSFDPADLLDALSDGISAVSSTPSFWRWLLTCASAEQLRGLGLAQITLGGEAADQPLLDRLRAAFPDARITHVYASTECGVVMACADGLAGFPAAVLERRPEERAPAVELRDGTLYVRSPYGVAGSEAWVDTRDLAELVDGRLHVRGRAGHGTINVGGQLVRLEELEAFVHELPDVAWARAYPVRSAIVDSLVGLDVVLATGSARSEGQAERDIRVACRRGLGEQYEPRIVHFLAEPALSPSLKRASR